MIPNNFGLNELEGLRELDNKNECIGFRDFESENKHV